MRENGRMSKVVTAEKIRVSPPTYSRVSDSMMVFRMYDGECHVHLDNKGWSAYFSCPKANVFQIQMDESLPQDWTQKSNKHDTRKPIDRVHSDFGKVWRESLAAFFCWQAYRHTYPPDYENPNKPWPDPDDFEVDWGRAKTQYGSLGSGRSAANVGGSVYPIDIPEGASDDEAMTIRWGVLNKMRDDLQRATRARRGAFGWEWDEMRNRAKAMIFGGDKLSVDADLMGSWEVEIGSDLTGSYVKKVSEVFYDMNADAALHKAEQFAQRHVGWKFWSPTERAKRGLAAIAYGQDDPYGTCVNCGHLGNEHTANGCDGCKAMGMVECRGFEDSRRYAAVERAVCPSCGCNEPYHDLGCKMMPVTFRCPDHAPPGAKRESFDDGVATCSECGARGGHVKPYRTASTNSGTKEGSVPRTATTLADELDAIFVKLVVALPQSSDDELLAIWREASDEQRKVTDRNMEDALARFRGKVMAEMEKRHIQHRATKTAADDIGYGWSGGLLSSLWHRFKEWLLRHNGYGDYADPYAFASLRTASTDLCPNCGAPLMWGDSEIHTLKPGVRGYPEDYAFCPSCEITWTEDTLAAEDPWVVEGSRTALNEVKAPPEVDTLRDEACPVCGETEAYTGEDCAVCGFKKPPDAFMDPDTEKAKATDLRQDRQDAADDAQSAPGPQLVCDNCGDTFGGAPGAPGAASAPSGTGLERFKVARRGLERFRVIKTAWGEKTKTKTFKPGTSPTEIQAWIGKLPKKVQPYVQQARISDGSIVVSVQWPSAPFQPENWVRDPEWDAMIPPEMWFVTEPVKAKDLRPGDKVWLQKPDSSVPNEGNPKPLVVKEIVHGPKGELWGWRSTSQTTQEIITAQDRGRWGGPAYDNIFYRLVPQNGRRARLASGRKELTVDYFGIYMTQPNLADTVLRGLERMKQTAGGSQDRRVWVESNGMGDVYHIASVAGDVDDIHATLLDMGVNRRWLKVTTPKTAALPLPTDGGTPAEDAQASTAPKAGDTCPTCGEGTLGPVQQGASPTQEVEGVTPPADPPPAQEAPATDGEGDESTEDEDESETDEPEAEEPEEDDEEADGSSWFPKDDKAEGDEDDDEDEDEDKD